MFTYPHVTLHNYQNTLMHKSEPKANPTLITHANKVYELKAKTIGTNEALTSSKSNFEVDLTSYYKELAKLLYPM